MGNPMFESLDFALKPGAQPGDSAFLINSGRHRLAFDAFPGRTITLPSFGSILEPAAELALRALEAERRLVDEGKAAFFAVVSELGSGPEMALEARFPSIRFLWDGGEMTRAFGGEKSWVILDPMLRVSEVAPLSEADRVLAHLSGSPSPSEAFGPCPPAPILALGHVFEPGLCAHLIACFERDGGKETGLCRIKADGRSRISTRRGSDGAISNYRPSSHRQFESTHRQAHLP